MCRRIPSFDDSGVPAQQGAIAATRLLTPNEEDALIEWILSMDRRGTPPHQATIKQMGTLSLQSVLQLEWSVQGGYYGLSIVTIRSSLNTIENTTISEQSAKILG
jgi:hypothetical protein